MRIASLLASATEIVCVLGLEDDLVAISHECDHPPEVLDRPRISRPRFDPDGLSGGEIDAVVRESMAMHGNVYILDEPALREVAPDLILTQAVCDVCAVPTSLAHEAARSLDGATVLSLDAHTVDGIFSTIIRVGEATGTTARAERVVAGLRARVAAVRDRVAHAVRPSVLALEWLDPVFTPGHWGPEMVESAGGANLLGTVGERSKTVTWDLLEACDPDVLLVMPCGYGLDRSIQEADAHADRIRAVAPRAVETERAFVLDGSSYFNRSGPRVVDGIEILGAVLHPECFPAVDLTGRAARWLCPSGPSRP